MNILYITGTHSSGKSVLVESLQRYPGIMLFPRQHRRELFCEEEYKLLYNQQPEKVKVLKNLSDRITTSVHETKRQIKLSTEYRQNIIVADHFLLDCMAYTLACVKLKWLTIEEFNLLEKRLQNELATNTNSNLYGFFIKPSFKTVKINFIRTNPKNSRFWEKHTDFLEVSCEMFNKVYTDYVKNSDDQWKIITSDHIEIQKKLVAKKINQLKHHVLGTTHI